MTSLIERWTEWNRKPLTENVSEWGLAWLDASVLLTYIAAAKCVSTAIFYIGMATQMLIILQLGEYEVSHPGFVMPWGAFSLIGKYTILGLAVLSFASWWYIVIEKGCGMIRWLNKEAGL